MDLSKLSPAPWWAVHTETAYPDVETGPTDDPSERFSVIERMDGADFAFIALARNAFDVMLQRGWSPERFSLLGGGFAWRIPMGQANEMIREHGVNAACFKNYAALTKWPDPFTALVEADRWYAEHIEKPRTTPS